MADARAEVLGRIRAALTDDGAADVPVPREYRRVDARPPGELVELLAARIVDYAAEAAVVAEDELPAVLGAVCERERARRLGAARAVPAAWRPDGVGVIEDRGLGLAEIDRLDGALTGCAVAIAETGTLVLDGGPLSGRRALTLLPDLHLCVVRADQVVGSVPEAVAAVHDTVTTTGAPITFVSGPSASSDIELDRVEGVHGPRRLRVFILR